LEQQPEFSLSETTHLVLFFLQKEQGNILKLVCLMCNASASRSKRFFLEERLVSILKEEKVEFHSTFYSNTLSN
jgi:hypothetical protein